MEKSVAGNTSPLYHGSEDYNKPRILLAEDDSEMRWLLSESLQKAGYIVLECKDGGELLDNLGSLYLPGTENWIDLIISDIKMPNATGMEILNGLNKKRLYFPPMILITAFGSKEIHEQAERFGAVAFFDKPFDMEDLTNKIEEILSINEGFNRIRNQH